MKNKYLFILFVCLLSPLTLKGQTSLDFHLDSRKNSLETNPINYLIDQNHLHASPHKIQTVNLDKVDMYTGIPNITIPLYNISVGDINIPISLSYNATGVNPNQLSSFVGLNWSLNTGGDITKQVKGVEDFGFTFSDPYLKHGTLVDYSNLKDVSFERGRGILSVGWLTDKDFSFYDYYNITPKGQKKVDLNRTFVEKRDPFPDFFIVNSPGLTTKFVHKKDGTPMEIEYKGFDIKSYIGKSPLINFKKELFNDKFEELARKYSGPGTNKINCINRIDIKNNDGIDYVYDVLDVNQYAERSGFLEIGPNTPAYLTSQGVIKYHPSKIQDKYGNVVKFEYETYSVEEPIHRKQFIYKCLSFQGYRDTPLQINSTQTTFPLLHKIKKIIFRGGSIEFFYNFERKDVPSDKALKIIIVKAQTTK